MFSDSLALRLFGAALRYLSSKYSVEGQPEKASKALTDSILLTDKPPVDLGRLNSNDQADFKALSSSFEEDDGLHGKYAHTRYEGLLKRARGETL